MELKEEMNKKKQCSYCGEEINTEMDTYYECLDNFLQMKYFDSEDENIFCSKKCFCNYVQLEEVDPLESE